MTARLGVGWPLCRSVWFAVARLAQASLLAMACAGVAAQVGSTAPPAFVQQAVPGAVLWGQGPLRIFGLRVYDARLWAGPEFDVADFAAHPLALELRYHRALKGAAIAQRALEEIARQGVVPPEQAQRWERALSTWLPDVQAGDRLTGVYLPGQGLGLWRNGQALGAIDDAELARRFMGIWLSPATSEPGLRQALLGRPAGAVP